MASDTIPFNKPYMGERELSYIAEAHRNHILAGDGPFTKRCDAWIEQQTGTSKALLTHSCTAALEMCALLLNIQPGDEIIMPSYTFVSTANAFVLRGGVPVFVDIRPDTLNLDESKIEAAITPKTRAIVPVHYAGVACEMDTILAIARQHRLSVIEDAAQGVMSCYKGRALGAIGELGAYSFHETKNIISGEGGCLLINDARLAPRAEVLREKGTNRSQFFRGQVDKYTWQDIGSSFLPGELIAAFLWAQLEQAADITAGRIALWQNYHEHFANLEARGWIRRPVIPQDCKHNAHLYYLLLDARFDRDTVLAELRAQGIHALFHYVPLHTSPAGKTFARTSGSVHCTETLSEKLIRLPMWVGLTREQQQRVIDTVITVLTRHS